MRMRDGEGIDQGEGTMRVRARVRVRVRVRQLNGGCFRSDELALLPKQAMVSC